MTLKGMATEESGPTEEEVQVVVVGGELVVGGLGAQSSVDDGTEGCADVDLGAGNCLVTQG